MAERFGDFELLAPVSVDAAFESYRARGAPGAPEVLLHRARKDVLNQAGFRDTLTEDAQAAFALSHPNIARVVGTGEVDHRPYLVQEQVVGTPLSELMARARAGGAWPLTTARALELVRPLAHALAHAHGRTPRVVHREVSPRNVFVTPDGRVLLTDFGLSRARRRAGGALQDAYVSPEQAHGQALDARSDVFAVGLLLYELVCGRLPAEGTMGEVISRIGQGELDPPRAVRPDLGPVADVLARALAASPAERYESGAALAQALDALEAAPGPEPLGAWAQRLAQADPAAAATNVPPVPAAPVEHAAPVSAPEASVPAPPRRARGAAVTRDGRLRLALAGAAVAVVLAAGAVAFTLAAAPVGRTVPPGPAIPETFMTHVVTYPAGATVTLDGREVGRTPYAFTATRGMLYQLSVRNRANDYALDLQNVTLVEVDLAHQRVLRLERMGPKPPATQQAKRPPEPPRAEDPPKDPAPAPPEEVAYSAPTAPATFVLRKEHQVRVDEAPQLPETVGLVRELQAGWSSRVADTLMRAAVGRNEKPRAAGTRASGALQSLLLVRYPARIEVRTLGKVAVAAGPTPAWAFALTERAAERQYDQPPHFEFGGKSLNPASGSLVVVDASDRFEVESLEPGPWTLRLRRLEENGTVPSPVVAWVRRAEALDHAPLLDGTPLESDVVVLDPGFDYALTDAESVWFTLLTVTGVRATPVEVSLTR